MYDLKVDILKIPLYTWSCKKYAAVTINIMGYHTGNVCYIVVINYQVLSYPPRIQKKIQKTRVQQ